MTRDPQSAATRARAFFKRFGREVAVELENDLERLSRFVSDDRLGKTVPLITGFAGCRNQTTARVKARVIRTPKIRGAPTSTFAKMHAMYRLYNSHELPDVPVILEAYGGTYEAVSDEEGYVSFEVVAPPPTDKVTAWESVTMRLAGEWANVDYDGEVTIPILLAGTDGNWAVISDIDDTIIETGAHNFVKNWRKVLVDQVEDRLAVPGAPDLYRAIAGNFQAPARPFFYVSSSPWNLYGFLTSFMERHEIPHGPMFLKDYGIDADKFIDAAHSDHKLDAIETILGFYPDQTFLLIGDNGQHDVEIYAQAVADYPERIGAVYIRDVHGNCADGSKAALFQQIRNAGVKLWCGSGFDDAVALTQSLGLSKPLEAAKAVEGGEGAGG